LAAIDPFAPLKRWVDQIEVHSTVNAHRICKLIPAQCPFARDITIFGQHWFSIPPLCKLNPLYEELMALRFRALSYLVDECGEDISCYC
jgi:hypothetical protein